MQPVRSHGVVSLVVYEGQIRFEVNLAAANREDLAISSKMLKLAEIVGP